MKLKYEPWSINNNLTPQKYPSKQCIWWHIKLSQQVEENGNWFLKLVKKITDLQNY